MIGDTVEATFAFIKQFMDYTATYPMYGLLVGVLLVLMIFMGGLFVSDVINTFSKTVIKAITIFSIAVVTRDATLVSESSDALDSEYLGENDDAATADDTDPTDPADPAHVRIHKYDGADSRH